MAGTELRQVFRNEGNRDCYLEGPLMLMVIQDEDGHFRHPIPSGNCFASSS